MPLSIGFPDEKQHMGACHKSRRDERPQTGAQAPGSRATIKEAPTGRQRPKQAVIEPVRDSVAPSGLPIVLRHYVGGLHPRLWSFAPSVLIPRTATSGTPAKGGVSRSSKRGPMRGIISGSMEKPRKQPAHEAHEPHGAYKANKAHEANKAQGTYEAHAANGPNRANEARNICFSAISLSMTRKVTIFAAS